MKIVNSAITLNSQHTYSQTSIKFETTNFLQELQKYNLREDQEQKKVKVIATQTKPSQIPVILIPQLKIQNLWCRVQPVQEAPALEQQKMLILERFLSVITGKKLRFRTSKSEFPVLISLDTNKTQRTDFDRTVMSKTNKYYQENETLVFKAKGVFKNADGKEINFQTELNLAREFTTLNNVNLKTGELVDPLIINYNGTAALLNETRFSFDIDADGEAEQIFSLNEGSGFLALDLNNDGTINDGNELFGTKSGNGFQDLANYDNDHNGWIDEGDQIYDKLRIWTKDSNTGNDQLFALGQKGVGAIYLGSIEAPFSFKNQFNMTIGENQRAGIFAREDGSIGTIQQADLVV